MKNKLDSIRDSIDLWSIYLPDCRDELESCRGLLTPKELARAAKFFKSADAERFILCRGLLRRILGGVLDIDPSSILFERNEYGKPLLPNTDIEFNVSHSRDRLLIAVTSGRSLGVDIEFRRNGIKMDAIADRWFAPAEREFFQGLEDPEIGFFDIWAKKEAYVKALGTGIFKELNSFAVPLGEEPNVPTLGPEQCERAFGTPKEATRRGAAKNGEWFFQPLEIDPAYATALVAEAPVIPIRLRTL